MSVRTDEIADGVFRLSTLVPEVAAPAGGFTFNQYLIRAEQPLLFHTARATCSATSARQWRG